MSEYVLKNIHTDEYVCELQKGFVAFCCSLEEAKPFIFQDAHLAERANLDLKMVPVWEIAIEMEREIRSLSQDLN